MGDNFSGAAGTLTAPALNAAAVTPSDTVALTTSSRALYIGVTGDVKVTMVGGGAAVVFTAVPVGILPVRAMLVWATATTATNIVAMW